MYKNKFINVVSVAVCVIVETGIIDEMAFNCLREAQWLSGRVIDSRPRGRGFESHQRHCVVSLSKTHLS